MTLATWITLTRLLGIPVLLIALHQPTASAQWLACGVFIAAASTDWLDGYVARRLNQVTDLGKFLDPLVDKLLVITPLLSLIALDKVPVVGVFLIIARELTIAGWRVNQATLSGANMWGKLKTVVQIIAIALLIAPLTGSWVMLGTVFFWLAVVLTLASGWIYLRPPGRGTPTPPEDSEVVFDDHPTPLPQDRQDPLHAKQKGHQPSEDPAELVRLRQNLVLMDNLHTFKSGFLSRVSHELRAPLNGIIGTHQLLLSDLCDSPEEEKEFLQHAHQSTLNLLAMLDTVLKVAKVEAGRTPLTIKTFSASDLLLDIEGLTAMQAADRTIPLNVQVPDSDFQILGDEAWLRQMVLNAVTELMQAVLTYSDQRGIIQLSATSNPDTHQVQITVAAELPFTAWSEPLETIDALGVPSAPGSQVATGNPGFNRWLDVSILEQMQGTLEYLEQPPGWTSLQFVVPLANA